MKTNNGVEHKKGIKSLRALYPAYFISKNKIDLENGVDVKVIFEQIKKKYKRIPLIRKTD